MKLLKIGPSFVYKNFYVFMNGLNIELQTKEFLVNRSYSCNPIRLKCIFDRIWLVLVGS